jgi:hypothetical protein
VRTRLRVLAPRHRRRRIVHLQEGLQGPQRLTRTPLRVPGSTSSVCSPVMSVRRWLAVLPVVLVARHPARKWLHPLVESGTQKAGAAGRKDRWPHGLRQQRSQRVWVAAAGRSPRLPPRNSARRDCASARARRRMAPALRRQRPQPVGCMLRRARRLQAPHAWVALRPLPVWMCRSPPQLPGADISEKTHRVRSPQRHPRRRRLRRPRTCQPRLQRPTPAR